MDASIVTVISSVGFPIVACIGAAWVIKSVLEDLRKSMDRNTDALLEIKTWIQAIDRRIGKDE